MNPLVLQYRKLRRQLQDLKGYLELDWHGNEIVRRTDFAHCPRPVLMLYGLLSTRRTFEVLEHRLRRDGYCVFSIKLGGLMETFNSRGIDECAERVLLEVERDVLDSELGAFPRHARLVSIYSREDKVSPFPCCRLEDDVVGNTSNVEIPGLSHREYLYKRAAYEVIRSELARTYGGEAGPPAQPVTLAPVHS